MSNDPLGHMMFLGLLVLALVIWFWLTYRRTPGRGAQTLTGWGLLFVAMLAAGGLWQDIKSGLDQRQALVAEDGKIEIPRSLDGHYYLTLDINGHATRFVVDTGATGMVLTRRAAQEAGLSPDTLAYYDVAHTANGEVRTAPVTLDTVGIGPFLDRDVKAYVNDGEMFTSLLGMDYIDRFDRLEISGGRMSLER